MGKQEALKHFAVDLTEQARKGEIDPIIGRDEEIRQIVDILMRRRQNNPILTGEAGVGKTAVVEGFALRIAQGDVPPPLKDVSLLTLDIGLLQAGASMKGEFENRLRQVIDEVQASPKPIILFIDEAHTLIGAGGAAGTGDAANLLKPALARGTLRTIAATTWAEYKKYFEKDPALTRRFQVVKVDEPTEEKAILMMRGVASDAREASPRAAARRGARGGGAAVAPLHSGAAAAGQGGEPARHGLRARRDQPARDAAGGRGLPPADRSARDRARDHRPRGGDRHRRRAAARATPKRSWRPSASGSRGSKSAGTRRRQLVDQILELRRSCAPAAKPVDADERRQAAKPLRADRQPSDGRRGRQAPVAEQRDCRRGAAALLAELHELQGKLAQAAGRDAADPAQRRRAGGRVGGRRLDRHPGRPDGEERDRGGAQARRHAQPARHRPAPRASR